MTWPEITKLIVAYGIPGAYQIWQIVTQHAEPSQEAWDKLNALALLSYDDYIAAAKAKTATAIPPAAPPPA